MHTNPSGGDGAPLPPRLVAAQRDVIGQFIGLCRAKLIATANRLIRYYSIDEIQLPAEVAVQGALLKLWEVVIDGGIKPIRTLDEFEKAAHLILDQHILDEGKAQRAIKRGGPGRWGSGPNGQQDEASETRPAPARGLCHNEDDPNCLTSDRPAPEELAIAKIDYEEFLAKLNDPVLETILHLMGEGLTIVEISRHTGHSPASVDHKIRRIRSLWRKSYPEVE